ncbi:Kelch domain-containing protein 2 isoform X1 [Oopsacas minuta]|uniref:Kelch domain-containing protein 2 isoform X1 n=1 Tax=Oopsacas minuta TaxID=111878 RepID=A0AAV7JTY0_9METZ|nr:Kelch domain-containing protein 2 isoform X1 [Oopsacas minuta]
MIKVVIDGVPGEPHPRRGSWSAVYEGGLYVWHGGWKTSDYHEYGCDDDAFSIFRLDLLSLKWDDLKLENGGGYNSEDMYALSCGSCTQNYKYVYTFGGHCMTGWYGADPFCNIIYQVDLETLKISRLKHKGQIPGSRDKTALFYYKDALYLFGGWSRYQNTVQKGANFVCHKSYKTLGWNNEFYRYDLLTAEWTNQELKGHFPPPTAASTLTRAGDKAYLVAGRNPPDRVDDVYVLDLITMVWEHYSNPVALAPPVPWPGPRSSHAVSPIYLTGGAQTPHLVMFGGLAPDDSAYNDVWLFDLTNLQWKQQKFQDNTLQIPCRTWFCMGATLNIWTSCFELCLFGGVQGSLLDQDILELADTLVLEMGISSLKRLACFAIINNFKALEPVIDTLPTVLRDNLRELHIARDSKQALFTVLSRFSPFKCFPLLSHLEHKP